MVARILNIVARTRTTVDAAKWIEMFGTTEADIRDEVRDYMVRLALESPAAKAGAITGVRRDRL